MKSSRVPLVVLAVLAIAVCALNYVWLWSNTLPPHWDQAYHMISALKYHAVLSKECFGLSAVTFRGLKHCAGELVYVDQFVYPPLFPLAGGFEIFLAGSSVTALAMTNVPFILILIASMYLMGRKIHSGLAGMLAALLIIAYPLIFQMSREFMLEFAMLAVSAAAACFLVLGDRFRKTGLTLLFGLATGLSALTKFTALTYLIGPGLYVFTCLMADVVRHRLDRREAARRVLTLAGALALGLAVSALWYWPNRSAFLESLRSVASMDIIGAPVLSPASLMYYPKAMIWTQMGPPLFLLFIYGAWRFARHVTPEWRDFLIAWICSIYLIQTAVSHKGPHDDIGILVPAALISAVGIASLPRRRGLAVAVVSCFAALQLAILTLPAWMLGDRVGTFGWAGVVTPFPRSEDWKLEGVLQSLATRPATVAVVSGHIFLNGTTLRYYALKDGLPLQISPCEKLGQGGALADFSRFDMVIAKSDNTWIRRAADGCFRGLNGREEYAAVIQRLEDRAAGFVLIRSVELPDGSSLRVFGAVKQ